MKKLIMVAAIALISISLVIAINLPDKTKDKLPELTKEKLEKVKLKAKDKLSEMNLSYKNITMLNSKGSLEIYEIEHEGGVIRWITGS